MVHPAQQAHSICERMAKCINYICVQVLVAEFTHCGVRTIVVNCNICSLPYSECGVFSIHLLEIVAWVLHYLPALCSICLMYCLVHSLWYQLVVMGC